MRLILRAVFAVVLMLCAAGASLAGDLQKPTKPIAGRGTGPAPPAVVAPIGMGHNLGMFMLDTTFNGTGKVTTELAPSNDYANAVAIQSDGKIVAAGVASGDFALARYNTNGTLDTTFSTTGKVMTNVGDNAFGPLYDEAYAVAIQSDGKIVVAGCVDDLGFALVRYNSNGTLDRTFNGTGKVITRISEYDIDCASAVAIQSDGKIVAAGYSLGSDDGDFFGGGSSPE